MESKDGASREPAPGSKEYWDKIQADNRQIVAAMNLSPEKRPRSKMDLYYDRVAAENKAGDSQNKSDG